MGDDKIHADRVAWACNVTCNPRKKHAEVGLWGLREIGGARGTKW